MRDFPQFLISMNKKDAPGRLFLLHAKRPRFIGEILTFKSFSDFEKFNTNANEKFLCEIEGKKSIISTHFEYKGNIVGLFVLDFFEVPLTLVDDSNFEGLMKRTAKWLQAYYTT